jgi:hypothetical protein
MSEEHHDTVDEAEDEVPARPVLRAVAATVAIGLALCLIAYLMLRLREWQLRPSMQFPEQHLPPPHSVAQIREQPFELPWAKPTLAQRQREQLQHYGWVDRQKGLVRVPIDTAIELMAAGRP